MARARSRRRRQNILIAVALAISVSVVALVHDISRIAAQSVANRVSLNRTFGTLATSIVLAENQWGTSVATLLTSGASMSRTKFAIAVAQEELQGHEILQRAQILAAPDLAHHVETTLIAVTERRVTGVDGLLNRVGEILVLPGTGRTSLSPVAAQGLFVRSDNQWASARRALRGEPGQVRLPRSVFALSTAALSRDVGVLAAAGSLAVHRAMSIAAVAITPAPLPEPSGQLVMISSSAVSVAVSVHNEEWVNQSFTLTFLLAPTTLGTPVSYTYHGQVGPQASRAVVFAPFAILPSERAHVTIALTGTPIAAGASGQRDYHLVVASAPVQ